MATTKTVNEEDAISELREIVENFGVVTTVQMLADTVSDILEEVDTTTSESEREMLQNAAELLSDVVLDLGE